MNDLLGNIREEDDGDFRSNRRARARQNPSYGRPGAGDVEMGDVPAPATEQETVMQQFFQSVDAIKADMKQIQQLQEEIESKHEKSKTLVKSKEVQKYRQDMQDLIDQVLLTAKKVKDKIQALENDNQAAKKVKGQGEGTANERTRTSVTAGLRKKLKDLMGNFSNLRTRIQDEYREVVERRIYTVTGQRVQDEELDRIIESGEAENIFQKAILHDQQGRGRVLDTLAEIQERQRAVHDLEQSLLELHQLFLDMAVLVETQGEMLDNIEKQVARSVDHVQSGVQALQDAKQLQKKTRKMMCCALMIVLLVALIIVLAVVQPWKFANSN